MPNNWIAELKALEAKMTPGEWDSLSYSLIRSPLESGGIDFGQYVLGTLCGDYTSIDEDIANVSGIVSLRNYAKRLIASAEAAEAVAKFDVRELCGDPRHRPLRSPLCGYCQLAARIEELRAALDLRSA